MKRLWLRYGSYNRLSNKDKRQIHARSLLGGGNQQGFYKGYLLSTGERYETAKNWNKSGNGYRTEEL
jgi:hypothetical protein